MMNTNSNMRKCERTRPFFPENGWRKQTDRKIVLFISGVEVAEVGSEAMMARQHTLDSPLSRTIS